MPCSSNVWYEKEFTLTIEKEGGTEGTGWLVVNTNGRFRGILFVHASSFWHKDSMQFILLESVLSKRKVLSFCLRPFSHRSIMIVLTEYLDLKFYQKYLQKVGKRNNRLISTSSLPNTWPFYIIIVFLILEQCYHYYDFISIFIY